MNVKIGKGPEIIRPTTVPLTSSILDHVSAAGNLKTVTEGFGWQNDAGVWPSYSCLETSIPVDMPCIDGEEDEDPAFKTFDTAEWQPAFTFAVQAGVQCNRVGLNVADMHSEIMRVFEANQGKGVERALVDVRFIDSGAAQPNTGGTERPTWTAPEDITPTGKTIPLTVALALLEGYAANRYAGLPTIHMPRAAATVLEISGLIVWNGDLAFTKNGSKVAIGGGYDDEDMLATGQWDMYATGEVYVEQSSEVDESGYVLPGDGSGTGSDENGLSNNTEIHLAERMFRVAIDCFVVMVTGTVWS